MRSAAHHIAGPEKDYDPYRFSGRIFLERPNHNPFADAGLLFTGAHDLTNGSAFLIDNDMPLFAADLVGDRVLNVTDGSEAIITGNGLTNVFGVLSGGVDNDWDIGDVYRIIAT